MTIQTIPFDSASSNASKETSQTLEFLVVGPHGETKLIAGRPSSASTVKCDVYRVEVRQPTVPDHGEFLDIDSLVSEAENDLTAAALIAEGRKWVTAGFYSDEMTLASLRLSVGLSQQQLAIKCNLLQPHVSRYETGRIEPSLSNAAVMASALNVSLNDFHKAWENSRAANVTESIE